MNLNIVKKRTVDLLAYVGSVLILLFFLFPILWQLLTSFKSQVDTTTIPPTIFFEPVLSNWISLVKKGFLLGLQNSVVVVGISTVITVIVGSLAAFAIVKGNFKGKKMLSLEFLTLRMFPPAAVVIPLFLVIRKFGLTDTHLGLIVVYTTFNLPLTVWLMMGYFRGVPKEIMDAALVDGCSWAGTFWKVFLPLSTPGLIAVTIFCVIFSWNEFMFALVLTGAATQTLPVKAAGVVTHFHIDWGALSAGAALTISVPMIFALIIQKHLVRGITLGAVK